MKVHSCIVTSNQSKAIALLKAVKLEGGIVLPDDVCNPRDPQVYLFQELPALF